jgi:hypothetical protein
VRTARLWNKLHQVRKKNQNIAIPNNFYFSYNVHNFNINTTIGNVVVVSPGGKNCSEILAQRDGLNKPYSLRINIDRNELLVCNKNGPAFVFCLH